MQAEVRHRCGSLSNGAMFWQALGEPLYRVSTGNYEYRLILRCRQEARTRFAKMRKDVLEKIELLDQKHGEYRCCVQYLKGSGRQGFALRAPPSS